MSKTITQCNKEAETLFNQQRLDEAIGAVSEALALDPNSGEAHFTQGRIWGAKLNNLEAAKSYQKAIDNGYDKAFVYRNLGNRLMALERTPEAIAAFEKAIELDPSTIYNNTLLGVLYNDIGKPQEAMDHYNKILAGQPNNYQGNYYKANLLFEQKQYEEAIVLYKKALQVFKNNDPGSAYKIGQAYLNLGNREEAEAAWHAADKMQPDNFLDFCSKGQCYYSLGKKKEALESFRKSRELIEKGTSTAYGPSYVQFVKDTLKSILEAEETNEKTEHVTKDLDKSDADVAEFLESVKVLQEKKDDLSEKLLSQIDNKKTVEAANNISELDSIKLELQKKMSERS